jgi:hypothetical protein
MAVLVALPVHSIEVYLNEQGKPLIRSELEHLHALAADESQAAVRGLLATILGHYLAGVDILTPIYVEGICKAVQCLKQQNPSDSPLLVPEQTNGGKEATVHPLAALAGKFSGPEWSDTWDEVARMRQRLDDPASQPE